MGNSSVTLEEGVPDVKSEMTVHGQVNNSTLSV
jgi:hypothetical protein